MPRDAPGTRFGPFDLLVRLGQGGMGEVWKARGPGPTGPDQVLVVKRMLSHLVTDTGMVRDFEREARLSESLQHVNIVRVFDFGRVADEYYLSMEYVDGVDLRFILRELRRRNERLPAAAAAYVIAAVCRALDYAYAGATIDGRALRLVHRDVSPVNVMCSFDGRVKLLDFGIAKALSENIDTRTTTGTLKGKIAYMAPEQVQGAPADHGTDQFAAGVVLHELLTGQRLFRGDTELQTIANIKQAVVPAPSSVNPEVPAALDEICLRALAREPQDRFPSCAAMMHALEAICAAARWDEAAQQAALAHLFPSREQVLEVDVGGSIAQLERTVPQRRTSTESVQRRASRRRLLVGVGVIVSATGLVVGGLRAWRMQAHATAAPGSPIAAPATAASPIATPAAAPTPTPAPSTAVQPDVDRQSPSLGTRAAGPAARPLRGRGKDGPTKPGARDVHTTDRRPAAPVGPTTTSGAVDVRSGQIVDPFAK